VSKTQFFSCPGATKKYDEVDKENPRANDSTTLQRWPRKIDAKISKLFGIMYYI
jgi:hypothetical protein